MARSFLQTLVVRGLLSPVDLERVAHLERVRPTLPLLRLFADGRVEEEALVRSLCERCELAAVVQEEVAGIEPRVIEPFQVSWLARWGVLPLRYSRRGDLVVGMVDPLLHEAREALVSLVGRPVATTVLPPALMQSAMVAFGAQRWSLTESSLLDPDQTCDARGIRAVVAGLETGAMRLQAPAAAQVLASPRLRRGLEGEEPPHRVPTHTGEQEVAEQTSSSPPGPFSLRPDTGIRRLDRIPQTVEVRLPEPMASGPHTGALSALGDGEESGRAGRQAPVQPVRWTFCARAAHGAEPASESVEAVVRVASEAIGLVRGRDELAEELVDTLAVVFPSVLFGWVRGDAMHLAAVHLLHRDGHRLVRREIPFVAGSSWHRLVEREELLEGVFSSADPIGAMMVAEGAQTLLGMPVRLGSRAVALLVLSGPRPEEAPRLGRGVESLHRGLSDALRRLILAMRSPG